MLAAVNLTASVEYLDDVFILKFSTRTSTLAEVFCGVRTMGTARRRARCAEADLVRQEQVANKDWVVAAR